MSTDQPQSLNAEPEARRRRFEKLGCGLLVCLSLFAVFFPCTRAITSVLQRTTVFHNTKDVVVSLHRYHELYRRFPPAKSIDEHGHVRSWRSLMRQSLGRGYNGGQPWDSPDNLRTAKETPHGGHSQLGFVCLAIVGESSMWAPDGTPRRMNDADDGSSRTGLVLMLKDTGIQYWEPRDLLFDGEKLVIEGDEDRPINYEGAILGLVDGSVRMIEQEDIDGRLIEILKRNDGLPVNYPFY